MLVSSLDAEDGGEDEERRANEAEAVDEKRMADECCCWEGGGEATCNNQFCVCTQKRGGSTFVCGPSENKTETEAKKKKEKVERSI